MNEIVIARHIFMQLCWAQGVAGITLSSTMHGGCVDSTKHMRPVAHSSWQQGSYLLRLVINLEEDAKNKRAPWRKAFVGVCVGMRAGCFGLPNRRQNVQGCFLLVGSEAQNNAQHAGEIFRAASQFTTWEYSPDRNFVWFDSSSINVHHKMPIRFVGDNFNSAIQVQVQVQKFFCVGSAWKMGLWLYINSIITLHSGASVENWEPRSEHDAFYVL